MTRLLHAAARGARIERAHFTTPDEWETARLLWASTPVESNYYYRIHPEDEALQYGPISTALREEAEAPGRYYYRAISNELQYGFDFGLADGGIYWYDLEADDLTRSLFLLILSDHFADLGM